MNIFSKEVRHIFHGFYAHACLAIVVFQMILGQTLVVYAQEAVIEQAILETEVTEVAEEVEVVENEEVQALEQTEQTELVELVDEVEQIEQLEPAGDILTTDEIPPNDVSDDVRGVEDNTVVDIDGESQDDTSQTTNNATNTESIEEETVEEIVEDPTEYTFIAQGFIKQEQDSVIPTGLTFDFVIAETDFENKQHGDVLTTQDVLSQLISITTTKVDLDTYFDEKQVLPEAEHEVTVETESETKVQVDPEAKIQDAESIKNILQDMLPDIFTEVSAQELEEPLALAAQTKKIAEQAEDNLHYKVFSGDEEVTELFNVTWSVGSIVAHLIPKRAVSAGEYRFEFVFVNPVNGEIFTYEQSFVFGVVAVNTDKDVYETGDTAKIHIGVLDKQGLPVCFADDEIYPQARITAPDGSESELNVINNNTCTVYDSTLTTPDYSTEFTFGQQGVYTLTIVADTGEGELSSVRTIIVEDNAPIVVMREAATRLYPFDFAPMKISLTFNEDFSGDIVESMPSSFDVQNVHAVLVRGGEELVLNVQQGEGHQTDRKTITIDGLSSIGGVDAGEKIIFSYEYDAPNTSPDFFVIGPIEFIHEGDDVRSGTITKERNGWQIANDAVLSGTAYSDQGATSLPDGVTIGVLVNGGSLQTTTTSGGSGAFSFAAVSINASDILTFFIDGDASRKGVTVTRSAGTGNISGLSIYQDHLIVRHEDGGPITDANLATANNGDTDIDAIYTITATVNTQTGKTLYIQTGDTFTPSIPLDLGGGVFISSTATLNAGTQTIYVAGDVNNNGTFTHTAGTDLIFDGTSSQSFNAGSSAIGSDVFITGSSTVVSLATSTMNLGTNDLTIGTSSTLYINGRTVVFDVLSNEGTFRMNGNETTTITTVDTDSGTWEYVGTGSYTIKDLGITAQPDFYNLLITGSSTLQKGLTVDGALNVAGNLIFNAGTYNGVPQAGEVITGDIIIATSANKFISSDNITLLEGNLYNYGNGDFNGGGFAFHGGATEHYLYGSTTFRQVYITGSNGKTFYFEAGQNFSITNNFDLEGSIGNLNKIRSTATGTHANLNLTNSADSQIIFTDPQEYLDVRDVYLYEEGSIFSPSLSPANSINNGNAAGWFGTAVTGTVYTDEGLVPMTSGDLVTALVDGIFVGSSTIDGSGNYTIVATTTFATSSILTVFIDSGNNFGGVVMNLGSSSDQTDIDIYEDRLIVRQGDATSLTTAHLDTANPGSYPNLTLLYSDGASLVVTASTALYIWSDTTFVPGSSIDINGDLDISSTTSSFDAGSNQIDLAGDLWLDGTLTGTPGTDLNFDSSSSQIFLVSQSVVLPFDIVATGTGHLISMQGLSVDIGSNDVYIGTGSTIDIVSSTLTADTLFNDGTMQIRKTSNAVFVNQDIDSGLWRYNDVTSGYRSISDFGGVDYYNLQVGGVGIGYGASTSLNIANTFSVVGVSFDAATNTITANTLQVQSGGTYYAGSATHTLNSLTMSSAPSSFYGQGAPFDINGGVSVTGGKLFLSSSTMNVSGNFISLTSNFNHASGTLILDGGDQSIGGLSFLLNNLTKIENTNDSTDSVLNILTNVAFSGSVTIDGLDGDDRINIVSSAPATQRSFTFSGTSTFAGDYLDITDNAVIDSSTGITVPIRPANSINGGNTSNWFINVTGTVYTDTGVTPIGSGKTVRLLINGTDSGLSGDTDGSGVYSISGSAVDSLVDGDVLTLFIDDETENGVMVTRYATTTIPTDFNIYQDTLIIRTEEATSTNNINLDVANNGDFGVSTDDITSIYEVTGGAYISGVGKHTIVWDGDSYAPGNSIDANGNMTIGYGSTLNATSNPVTVAGDVTNLGTFTHTTGSTLTFDGGVIQYFVASSSAIGSNIVITGSTTVQLATTSLNIGSGTTTISSDSILDIAGQNMTFGSLSNDGRFKLLGSETVSLTNQDADSGTWEYYGTSSYSIKEFSTVFARDYYNLDITGSTTVTKSNTVDGVLGVTNNMSLYAGTYDGTLHSIEQIDGDLLIGTSTFFKQSDAFIQVAGDFFNYGTFDHNFGQTSFSSGISTTTHYLYGSTTFFVLYTVGAGQNIFYLESGTTFRVLIGLDIDSNVPSQPTIIRSTVSGSEAYFDLTTTASNSVNGTAYYDIQDNYLLVNGSVRTPALNPATSTNSGNAAGWFPIEITGTVYTDMGSATMGANKTVRLLVNGVDTGLTDDTNASGTYAIVGAAVESLLVGDVLALYIDDETENGIVFTTATGTYMYGIDIYQDHTILRSDGSPTITYANVLTALGGVLNSPPNDPGTVDIGDPFGVTELISIIGNIVFLSNTTETTLFVPTGHTVDLSGATGINLNIANSYIDGIYTQAPVMQSEGGDWYVGPGATYNSNSAALNFTVYANATMTMTHYPSVDVDVTFGGDPGAMKLGTDLTITGGESLIVFDGTVALQGNDLHLVGGGNLDLDFDNDEDGTLELYGSETVSGVTFAVDRGTWKYVGDGDGVADTFTIKDFGASDYHNLIINDTASTSDIFVLSSSLNVFGSTTVLDGTMSTNAFAFDTNGSVAIGTGGVLNGSSSTITVGGNWTNSGNFAAETSSVTFDTNANHNLVGSTTFYDFTLNELNNNSVDTQLTVDNTATITFTGRLTLDGRDSNDMLNIVSDLPGSTADFVFSGALATTSISNYIDVSDNIITNAGGSTVLLPINPTDSINSGNTTNWFGTLSGVLYTATGVASSTLNGVAIRALVNGVDIGYVGTTSNNAAGGGEDGEFVLPFGGVVNGDVVTLFADNSSTNAALVFKYGSTSSTTKNILYASSLALRSDDGSSITNTNIDTGHNGDADLTEVYINSGGVNLVSATASLRVASSTNYAPGGNITVTGNFYIDGTGTYTTSGETVTFTNHTQIMYFDSNNQIFSNVVSNAVTWYVFLAEDLVTTNLTLSTSSNLRTQGYDLTVSGVFSNLGSLYQFGNENIQLVQDTDSGIWQITGGHSGTPVDVVVRDYGAIDYYFLIISSDNSGHTFYATSTNLRTAWLSVGVGNFIATSTDIVVTSSMSVVSGTFTIGSSLVTSAHINVFGGTLNLGSATTTITILDFYMPGGVVNGGTGPLVIAQDLIINGGTFTAPSSTTTIGVDMTVSAGASFVHNNGSVDFNGTNNTIYPVASTTFYNLYKQDTTNDGATTTLTLGGNIGIAGALQIAGLDSNDLVSIVSTTTGATTTIDFSGASTFTGSYLSIKDNKLTDNSTGIVLPLNPANSINAGNTLGWFGGSLTFSTTTYTEAVANNGSIGNSIFITLTGDSFATTSGTLLSGVDFTTTNVPAGLSVVITATSATSAVMTLTGNATLHTNAQDIANLGVTFLDTAFATGPASYISSSTVTDITVDFVNPPQLTYSTSTFQESTANDGTIPTVSTVVLTGDTFTASSGPMTNGVHYNVANVPSGLTVVVTGISATSASITFAGTSTAHANTNDISNFTINFLNGAFTNVSATNVSSSTVNNFLINFNDQAIIAYAGNFTESVTNDGSASGTRTATITGDTFVNAGGVLVENTHFSLTNKPAGLTPVMTVNGGGTAVSLSFTGSSTAHANSNDVSNLGITFLNGAFTNTLVASNTTHYTNATGSIDFIDISLAYSHLSFTESTANDGSIGNNPITITLTGDTFAANVVSSNLITISGVPAGLTATLVRVDNTHITYSLTGSSTAHANSNDATTTINFLAGAFVNAPVGNVASSTGINARVDFTDAAVVSYSGSFAESVTNDGSVTGSITATLSGDTYAASIASGTQYTIANLPAGLTVVATRASSTAVVFTITGSSTAHANSNDVSNLGITFLNGAFTNTLVATNVAGNSYSAGVINFFDVTLTYGNTIFSESTNNNGTITSTSSLTLTGDSFSTSSGVFTSGVHFTTSNVPAGLTVVVTVTTATTAVVSITGAATAHANSNDVSNMGIAFLAAAFANVTNPATVTGASVANLSVDFRDVFLTYSTSIVQEAPQNDGSISTTMIVTLTGDSFASSSGSMASGTHYTVANLPTGLNMSIVFNSVSQITISLTGTSTAHANINDVPNLTINFLNSAFAVTPATGVTGSGTTTLYIDFADQAVISYVGSFGESATNNGTVSGGIVASIVGDTFAVSGVMASGTHYSIGNLPAGLTAVMTVNGAQTTATLTLTGTSSAHANSNDVNNLSIIFLDDAFTNTSLASNVNNSTNASGTIDFIDVTLVYGTTTFTERLANDGGISATSSITLSGDTFVLSSGTLTTGVHYTLVGVPTGLTPVITLTTATSAVLSFSGTATAHDVVNSTTTLSLVFLDAAFINAPAANVASSTVTGVSINFLAQPSISYAGVFVESSTNNGSASGTRTATITGDTFVNAGGALTASTHYTVTGTPAGLTPVVTVNASGTIASLTFTGTASPHTNTQDATTTLTFLNGAFTNTSLASNVNNSTNASGTIDFIDVTLAYGTTTFTEAGSNNGSVSGTSSIVLTGDSFAITSGAMTSGIHFSTTNTPTGLTVVITALSATSAVLSFSGNATAHDTGNSVSNISLVFLNAGFANALAAQVSSSTVTGISITFSGTSTIIIIDSDGDGLPDSVDPTPNNGNDPVVGGGGGDGPGGVPPLDADSDGLSDAFETQFCIDYPAVASCSGASPSQPLDLNDDTDGDGIFDWIEFIYGTDPDDVNSPTTGGATDTDGDTITDAEEDLVCSAYPSVLNCPDIDTTQDTDGDGIPDIVEFRYGSDPIDADLDIDVDGVADAIEMAGFNKTGGVADGNADGVPDHLQAYVAGVPVVSDTATYNGTVYQVVAVDKNTSSCAVISQAQGKSESQIQNNSSLEFPYGLVEFLLRCDTVGDTADVTIYYNSTAETLSALTVKKFVDGSYKNMSAVTTILSAPAIDTVGTTSVTAFTFQVTDGGDEDADNTADGYIEDPVGLSKTVSSSGGGGGGGGSRRSSTSYCGDPRAVNYVASSTAKLDNRLCAYLPGVLNPQQLLQEIMPTNTLVCTSPVYLKNPVEYGTQNNPEDVKLLEKFLNTYENTNLPVDGFYSPIDKAAVIKWQEKYPQEILAPWGLTRGTGYVFLTSLKKIKQIHETQCVQHVVEQPAPIIPVAPISIPTVVQVPVIDQNSKLSCGTSIYFSQRVSTGASNNIEEVKYIERFLNTYHNTKLPVDGVYTEADKQAIMNWQNLYGEQLLAPWGLTESVGVVFTSSAEKMNQIHKAACAFTNQQNATTTVVVPVLQPQQPSQLLQEVIPTNNTNGCFVYTVNLEQGIEGPEILKLQNILVALRLMSTNPNGYFGPSTKQAVMDYQKRYSIPQTGIVGPLTAEKLVQETCSLQ